MAYFVVLMQLMWKLWPAEVALFISLAIIATCDIKDSLETGEYAMIIKDGIHHMTFIYVLMITQLELRLKAITMSFILALSLALFFGIHVPELLTLFFRASPLEALLLTLHKIIELPLIVAFSSSLIMNGKTRWTACFFFGILVICPYLHRLLSSAYSF